MAALTLTLMSKCAPVCQPRASRRARYQFRRTRCPGGDGACDGGNATRA